MSLVVNLILRGLKMIFLFKIMTFSFLQLGTLSMFNHATLTTWCQLVEMITANELSFSKRSIINHFLVWKTYSLSQFAGLWLGVSLVTFDGLIRHIVGSNWLWTSKNSNISSLLIWQKPNTFLSWKIWRGNSLYCNSSKWDVKQKLEWEQYRPIDLKITLNRPKAKLLS